MTNYNLFPQNTFSGCSLCSCCG